VPIISSIGRKHVTVRALREGIFVALIIGAVTMLYPFLLMLAGSTKSVVDVRENGIVPRFLHDDTALYRKHVEAMFDERLDPMRAAYDEDLVSFADLRPPAHPNEKFVALWREFVAQGGAASPSPGSGGGDAAVPLYTLGHVFSPNARTAPFNFRAFKEWMTERTGGDIARLNREYDTEFVDWTAFTVMTEDFLSRRVQRVDTPFRLAFREFKQQQPSWWRVYFLVDGRYKLFLRELYSRDIARYNAEHGTNCRSYDEIHLTRTLPDGTPQQKKDWEDFVRHTLNPLWIRVGTNAVPADDEALASAPANAIRVVNTVFDFQDFLRLRFQDVAEMNAAIGTSFGTFEETRPPMKDVHYLDFLAHRGELRWEFATRNYAAVLDYLLFHGRGLRTTVIYCLLAMAVALIFNPLAAYALSRYRPRSQYKILLFLLLTMAFPPMVTQIPVFLTLRDWNLLNTFAALILPGLAHGYSIFLLKGFFDSQPRELYESAQIDGAGEWTIFWQITMSLAKPILSVIALNAFTVAYSNFLFALLTCQDQRMWTLMVWLYQLQQRSGTGVTYASLILAAIPTFVVFAFCQKIILRGIVVPSEK